MEIEELKEQLLKYNVPKFLILDVQNYALCRNYLRKIQKITNKKISYYIDANQVLYEINTNINDKCLYIIWFDDKVLKNPRYIEELKNTNENIILYYENIDKKSEFYKNNKKEIVEIKKLDENKLIEYFIKKIDKENINIETSKLKQIINYCNNDLGCCENELDKIINLWYINREYFNIYLKENKFPDYRPVNTFWLIKDILNRNKIDFENIKKINESNMTFLILLYNNAINQFNKTLDTKNIDIIKLSSTLNEKIVKGEINSKYAIDYLLLKTVYK